MTGIDWPGLMRAGLCGLRLSPETFWRLTPVELMVMLGRDGADAPLSRARLDDLARAYPDTQGETSDGSTGRVRRRD